MCKIADWIMLLILIVVSVIDWRKREIPIWILVVMSASVIVFAMYCKDVNIWYRLSGVAFGALFFLVSRVTRESIGYGDSWIILLLGAYLGIFRVLQVLFGASLISAFCALFYLWKCKWKRDATLPFVPFLTIAYLGVMIG